MKDDMLEIINTFGVNNQLKKFNEECFELVEAIKDTEYVKYNNVRKKVLNCDRKHIIEEMADVLNLLQQFVFYYEIEQKELDEQLQYKVERTLERIKNNYYE